MTTYRLSLEPEKTLHYAKLPEGKTLDTATAPELEESLKNAQHIRSQLVGSVYSDALDDDISRLQEEINARGTSK